VKRFLLLAAGLWLTAGLGLAFHAAAADELYFGPPNGEGCLYSGSDAWGRVNPAVCVFPTVSIANDLVVLQRSAPAGQAILFDSLGNTLLDASDLGAATEAGYRLNITFFEQNGWDFMFDMLIMGEMFSRQSVDSSGGVDLFFYQGVALDPVDTATFRSDLDTGEFNARYRFSPHVAVLGGVRYLELSEHLNFNEGSSNSGYRSQSDNRLIGGQLGAEGVLPLWGYGRLFAVGKYGIYNNRFDVAAQALSGGSEVHMRVHDDMSAGVGEFNAGWEVQTVPCMTLRFGYQALWLRNMALTTDQLNQYFLLDGSGNVRKGHPVYHGGFGGVVFTF
jgi:hypothetical protein